jgi:hypothetical protein
MKPVHIIMLCVTLLIQGISQSYAAQMMTAQATKSAVETAHKMPCHDMPSPMQVDTQTAMNDCCDQDCQCDMLTCAMIINTLTAHNRGTSEHVVHRPYSFFTPLTGNLYRPPISA